MSAFVDSINRARAGLAERAADVPSPELASRLSSLRSDGLAAFDERGLPTRRDERWKGTHTTRLADLGFDRVGPADAFDDTTRDAILEDPRVVAFDADLLFVDGRIVRGSASRADLPAGVQILSLEEAATEIPEVVAAKLGALVDPKTDAIAALNAGLFEDAAVVTLAPNTRPGRVLRILSLATGASDEPTANFARLLVVAGTGSEGMIVFESASLGDAPGFTSVVSEFHVADDAKIVAAELQSASASRVQISQTRAALERDARFASHVLCLSEGFVRSEVEASMNAPGGLAGLYGLFLGRDQAHHDHFTTVEHAAAHCESDEEYRGVLTDRAAGVFRGRVLVRPDAQKTDARQSNPNLLLSEGASIDTKPQLEIYADDVKASHGSTIGRLDEEALFFLRARGIDEATARLLLTRGFAQTFVDGIADESARSLVTERLEEALAGLESGAGESTA
ncbi:MAG: Fe-S cluster assembly protein SufD [bacterium]|nr:Fe-S cluster assembly protein SufD [bacterium]